MFLRSKLYGQPAFAPPEGDGGSGQPGGGNAGAGSAGGAGASAGGGAGGSGGEPGWLATVAGEHKGLWASKGWDASDPAKLVSTVTEAYQQAEKFIGAPAAELLRLPKAGDLNAQRAMWTRLGAPADASGYDFAAVKREGDVALDASLVDQVRAAAHTHGLTKEAASGMAAAFAKFLDGEASRASSMATSALDEEKAKLAANWGANFDANKFVAGQAAARLGVKPEEVTALEGVVGYSRVMEMFRSLGARMGEAGFVTGNNPANPGGVMSRDEAVARKGQLMADKAWTTRYLAAGHEEVKEMTALNTIIAGASVRRT